MKKNILKIVLALLCLNFGANGQNKPPIRISGIVHDSKRNALAGATVMLKGTAIKTMTDESGNFIISTTSIEDILLVSYLSFEPVEIRFNQKTNPGPFNVSLNDKESSLKEVEIVSTGYQVLPRERATGSFSQVDNNLFNRRVSTNLIDRLEGNVPGLLFNKNTSGSLNDKPDINIRGHSTLFANDQPLIVIDNFPYDGNISNINPNDIENISILKDAAAASIWGVRSGNGVIIITTKKGKRNQNLKVEFNSNFSVGGKPNLYYKPNESITSSDRIDLEQSLFASGFYSNDLNSSSFPAVPPAVTILNKIKDHSIDSLTGYRQIDDLKLIDNRSDLLKYFYQKSISQQYALNFRGGGSNSDYYFSLGYDKNRSSHIGNGNKRININAQYNFYPIKNLSISAGINYTITKGQNNSILGELNTLKTSGKLSTYSDLVDDQTGSALSVPRLNPDYLVSAASKFLNWTYRPFDELQLADNQTFQSHNKFNLSTAYKIVNGLSIAAMYQYEKGLSTTSNDFKQETYYARNLINQFTNLTATNPYPVPIGGILNSSRAELISNRGRIQTDYHKAWGDEYEITAIAGAEISETVNATDANTAYGYNRDTQTSINVDFVTRFPTNPSGSSAIPNINGFGKYTDRYVSYFSNSAFTYKGKYIYSVSGRIDKSNLFGINTNQKAVPLYSMGLAWNFSKESFYPLKLIPYAKLRLTYGYNGNVDKSATAVTTFNIANSAFYYNLPYAYITSPGNPDLRWERVRIVNMAVDFGLKNDVLTGSFDYYIKNGIDLFGNSSLPGSTGYTAYYGNTANTKSHGFDINLNSINISSKNFRWVSNLQISHAIDIVSKYNVQLMPTSYLSGARASIIQPLEGRPLFAVYSFRSAELTHATGDPQGYLNGNLSTDYAAILANTTIDSMIYNGPARPTIFGSFRNTISYQKLSLSFNLIYKFNYSYRRNTISYAGLYAGGGNADYYQRWQKPGDELITKIPSAQYLPVNSSRETFYLLSDAFVEKGDHIRLQDISLSYDMDISSVTKQSISQIQFYGSVNNVAILWRANKSGTDPDVYSGAYPSSTTFSIGFRAKF